MQPFYSGRNKLSLVNRGMLVKAYARMNTYFQRMQENGSIGEVSAGEKTAFDI